jgi:hypothetical protein
VHPHNAAVVKMIAAMERAGYRPSTAEHRNKSFAEDPIAWLGPWHIDVPNDEPFQVEWRLTIFDTGEVQQLPSFVSAEYYGRFGERLVDVMVREWERMGRVGMPETVVDRGRRLVEKAAEEYAQQRVGQSISTYKLDEEKSLAHDYMLRVEFCDQQGFADAEGVDPPHARAILLFTYLQPEGGKTGQVRLSEDR